MFGRTPRCTSAVLISCSDADYMYYLLREYSWYVVCVVVVGQVVSKFCEKVGDLELRVNLAKKYECHNVALEVSG
jgi:hypothetical protein